MHIIQGWYLHHLSLNDQLPSTAGSQRTCSISTSTAPTPPVNSPMRELNHSICFTKTLFEFFCLRSNFNKSVEWYQSSLLFPFLAVSERNISQPALHIFSDFLGLSQNFVFRLGKTWVCISHNLLEFQDRRVLAESLQRLECYLRIFSLVLPQAALCITENQSPTPLLPFKNKLFTESHRQQNNSVALLPAPGSAQRDSNKK